MQGHGSGLQLESGAPLEMREESDFIEDEVDPEVFASLPPEIRRELKLASMMKMGATKRTARNGVQKNEEPSTQHQYTTAKRKKPSIATFFGAKQ